MTTLPFDSRTPAHSLAQAPAASSNQGEGSRRVLNVTVAAAGVALAAPVMLLIAALIKLTSRGPVFYTQTRVGLDRRNPQLVPVHWRRRLDLGGMPFTIYKFRTMRADNNGAEVWARPDDPRVTALGRIMRLYRLDELPQFFNVLRGDMNVVGPRPEQPVIFASLQEQIERYRERQRVRPGITGWAQINQRYDSSLEDVRRKVAFDLEYLARQSFLEDVRIMLRTVPVMLLKLGAW